MKTPIRTSFYIEGFASFGISDTPQKLQMRLRDALRRVRLGAGMYHEEVRRARRGQSPPLPPCCGRGISEPHCDGVPAFARYKSILRMYLVGTESIGRLMPTNLSVCARMSAQWYCATFRGAASSLGRHPALNICQRLFASCMRT